jgi:hypothetical protein
MTFSLYPILQEIKEFYQNPISGERFVEYLKKLQGGSKGDMKLPIGGFNPMAKPHLLEKIADLEEINAEALMIDSLNEVNKSISKDVKEEITVVLNLADDLLGGWTNRYTTDFDSKFKINALVNRSFCTPYFWTSEHYNAKEVKDRTREYAFRTIYWKQNGRLRTLEDHFLQEVFVAKNSTRKWGAEIGGELVDLLLWLEEHRNSDDYSLIFNFFYGDEACQSLGYPTFGVGELTGFDVARHFSEKG